MAGTDGSVVWRAPLAGLLAWVLPGLGHVFVGERKRGLVLMVTIGATFWAGVAIGGAASTVDPQARQLWFMAQIVNGGHTLAALGLHQAILRRAERDGMFASQPRPRDVSAYFGHWMSIDVGVHYTGIAGLLNLLAILDAIARADATASRRPWGVSAVTTPARGP